MPLIDVDVMADARPMPDRVRMFLREAQRRIERFQEECRVPAFVSSDFARVYAILRAIDGGRFAAGNLFCEWGSGFGVVACLAAMLEFDACGIEIEEELVKNAQHLAEDFDLPVQFVHGSFLTVEDELGLQEGDEFAWLSTEGQRRSGDLDIEPADFDVVFAYPWPDEEQLIARLFERHARAGALLVGYHGGDRLRVRRKTRGSSAVADGLVNGLECNGKSEPLSGRRRRRGRKE